MNAVVQAVTDAPANAIVPQSGRNTITEVLQHVKAVQEVMRSVMKEGVHYGTVPGAGDKPTLFKSGAEVLCMTFRIDDDYEVEDLSTADVIRYRVKCIGRHQQTCMRLGSGLGECSTGEDKYRWRKAVCAEEFEATPPNMRRVKYGKKQGGFYTVDQVRTEPADLANTILKMAMKRAKIAMVLNVTGASDMFSQDLEDLDTELVRHLADDERAAQVQMIRDDWIAKANAAKSREELGKVMKEGVQVFKASRDTDGYAAFAKAVQEKGATFPKENNDA